MGGRAGLIDAYLAAIMAILGLIAAAYAIQATMRLRVEESSLQAEPVLATAVTRLRWAGSHLAFSVLGPTVALAAAGLAAELAHPRGRPAWSSWSAATAKPGTCPPGGPRPASRQPTCCAARSARRPAPGW